jgi:hypothetical protein
LVNPFFSLTGFFLLYTCWACDQLYGTREVHKSSNDCLIDEIICEIVTSGWIWFILGIW